MTTPRLLAHYASGGDLPWLAEQTYLAPFPAGLRLRQAVTTSLDG